HRKKTKPKKFLHRPHLHWIFDEAAQQHCQQQRFYRIIRERCQQEPGGKIMGHRAEQPDWEYPNDVYPPVPGLAQQKRTEQNGIRKPERRWARLAERHPKKIRKVERCLEQAERKDTPELR